MASFFARALLASLACFELFVSASPGPQVVGGSGAVISSSAQSMVSKALTAQHATANQFDLLALEALAKLVSTVETKGWPSPATCNWTNIYFRREWSTFSTEQKKNYINAVLCLQKRPTQLNTTLVPGARTRYDDFVGVHIQQTMTIHFTGNFLTWHRYFTWAYEHALRNECGYTGYQPYYNWGRWADNPLASPLFDGSDTSISGDGAFYNHSTVAIPPPPLDSVFFFPPANGGGNVTSGPFVNWTVNLGPVAPILPYIPSNPQPDGLGYNPRHLIRDISALIASTWTSDGEIADLLVNYTDIGSFQNRLQGNFVPPLYFGIHSGGHFTVGGDPGGDFYSSPGDPYFFFHHSSIERLFWTWQNMNLSSRTNVIAGTITFLNNPPSRPAELTDVLDLRPLNEIGTLEIGNALSTLGENGSPFCYFYL